MFVVFAAPRFRPLSWHLRPPSALRRLHAHGSHCQVYNATLLHHFGEPVNTSQPSRPDRDALSAEVRIKPDSHHFRHRLGSQLACAFGPPGVTTRSKASSLSRSVGQTSAEHLGLSIRSVADLDNGKVRLLRRALALKLPHYRRSSSLQR